MIRIERTDSDNPDFQRLVNELDSDFALREGDFHDFYEQFNGMENIKYVVIVRWHNKVVGCGAIKPFDDDTMEIKRMFVDSEYRGYGVATLILNELENWSRELHMHRCILETGEKQFESVALYKKNEYSVIPNFGEYVGAEHSICFEKIL